MYCGTNNEVKKSGARTASILRKDNRGNGGVGEIALFSDLANIVTPSKPSLT